jgi:hypothetical protein
MSEVPANYVQCLIPALEGLLPEPHNEILLSLCFTLATWHAYAKLRMHSASSIQCFKDVTIDLGTRVRHFQRTTCEFYETYELPKEQTRRARRDAQKAKTSSTTKKRKYWNTATYKYHSLGDYPYIIPIIGTTDSYSTQIVCFHALAE